MSAPRPVYPGNAVTKPAGKRSIWVRPNPRIGLLLALSCLLVYNANLRTISAADAFGARYLPFGIWRYHTLLMDPISAIAAQGRLIAKSQRNANDAFWIVRGRENHLVSLYPIVAPVVIAPLYLPAVAYLQMTGWDQPRMERLARIMEKASSSLIAATSVMLLFFLLRRRTNLRIAVVLSLAFAFGTTTWVIGSQALWQHGLAQTLIIAALLLLTGPPTVRSALGAGFLCVLIASNRPPDAILALGLGVYGLWWARRLAPLLLAGGALPLLLVLVYNVGVVGNLAGAYGLIGRATFFHHNLFAGLAGILFSPARGLFIFSPFLLFLPFGFRAVFRDPYARGLTLAISIAVVLQLALYAKSDWRQGACWGPRWLTDLLPVLIWMLPPVLAALNGAGRVAFAAACVIAVAIQFVGAFWYTGTSDRALFAAVAADGTAPFWRWRNAPFLAELRHGPAPADLTTVVRGNLDTLATSGETGSGVVSGKEIAVQGWALADNGTPNEVVVYVDGVTGASTGNFLTRPDVAHAVNTGSASGWQVTIPARVLAPGQHALGVAVRAYDGSELRFLAQWPFQVQAVTAESGDLAPRAQRAIEAILRHQTPQGYWLTAHTRKQRFENPGSELNTYLNAMMIDMLDPIAKSASLGGSLRRAREYLRGQIEEGGLVRYHGRPDAPTIGTLGCRITPDADDTALTWRIAPGADASLLPSALATLKRYRTSEGLYKTWLAPRDHYECLDPGSDPNPADIVIQMHIFLWLAQVDPAEARSLCGGMQRAIDDDRFWVYYRNAPLVPILRRADLQRAGCTLPLPESQSQTEAVGQDSWIEAARFLEKSGGARVSVETEEQISDLLRALSEDNFSVLRRTPPLLYHNDETASVRRIYWSEDFGYALWLRLYFANALHH